MDYFIEVEGTASAEERLVEHRAVLTLHVRAPQLEGAITQAAELRDQCIRTLLEAGLEKSELTEGGAELSRTWWWRNKNVGQEASHKILMSCANSARMHKALGALEPLFQDKRNSLDVSMLSPTFDFPAEVREGCQRDALDDAKTKAAVLADAAGVDLGDIVQIQELSTSHTRSGAYGDQDWG
jgi:uncharacterized protein YggE